MKKSDFHLCCWSREHSKHAVAQKLSGSSSQRKRFFLYRQGGDAIWDSSELPHVLTLRVRGAGSGGRAQRHGKAGKRVRESQENKVNFLSPYRGASTFTGDKMGLKSWAEG